MAAITLEMILLFGIGCLIGYIIGKLLKAIIALIILIIILGLLGIAFLNIDYFEILGALKPLASSFINFIRSRIEIMVGFLLGLIIGIIR